MKELSDQMEEKPNLINFLARLAKSYGEMFYWVNSHKHPNKNIKTPMTIKIPLFTNIFFNILIFYYKFMKSINIIFLICRKKKKNSKQLFLYYWKNISLSLNSHKKSENNINNSNENYIFLRKNILNYI